MPTTVDADVLRLCQPTSFFVGDAMKNRMFGYDTQLNDLVVKVGDQYRRIHSFDKEYFDHEIDAINTRINSILAGDAGYLVQSDLDAVNDRFSKYLPLAGGEMTGSIFFNGYGDGLYGNYLTLNSYATTLNSPIVVIPSGQLIINQAYRSYSPCISIQQYNMEAPAVRITTNEQCIYAKVDAGSTAIAIEAIGSENHGIRTTGIDTSVVDINFQGYFPDYFTDALSGNPSNITPGYMPTRNFNTDNSAPIGGLILGHGFTATAKTNREGAWRIRPARRYDNAGEVLSFEQYIGSTWRIRFIFDNNTSKKLIDGNV